MLKDILRRIGGGAPDSEVKDTRRFGKQAPEAPVPPVRKSFGRRNAPKVPSGGKLPKR